MLGASKVKLIASESLVGGAIQDTRTLDLDVTGGEYNGRQTWVLRCDAASSILESRTRLEEHALIEAAWQAGVRVPKPIAVGRLSTGKVFTIVERLPGIGLGPKVVRDSHLGGERARLVEELGRQLASIHRIDPSTPVLKPLALAQQPDTVEQLLSLIHI